MAIHQRSLIAIVQVDVREGLNTGPSQSRNVDISQGDYEDPMRYRSHNTDIPHDDRQKSRLGARFEKVGTARPFTATKSRERDRNGSSANQMPSQSHSCRKDNEPSTARERQGEEDQSTKGPYRREGEERGQDIVYDREYVMEGDEGWNWKNSNSCLVSVEEEGTLTVYPPCALTRKDGCHEYWQRSTESERWLVRVVVPSTQWTSR